MSSDSSSSLPPSPLMPGLRSDISPPYYDLTYQPFQGLCRDLFEMEETVAFCYVFGPPGQKQYGIDLMAHRSSFDGIEVGQCKCYKVFSEADLDKASEDFLDYWSYWQDKGVKRFILFIASDILRTEMSASIQRQTARFLAHGIKYEAWGASKITNKLRRQRGIVAQHLDRQGTLWQDLICGSSSSSQIPGTTDQPFNVLVADSGSKSLTAPVFEAEHDGYISNQLEEIRQAWGDGDHDKVKAWIAQIRADKSRWDHLSPLLKSRILRFESNVVLFLTEDIGHATALADEAHLFAPDEDESRIRALILSVQKRFDEALLLLEPKEDNDSLKLRASILLQSGRVEDAQRLLGLTDEGMDGNADNQA